MTDTLHKNLFWVRQRSNPLRFLTAPIFYIGRILLWVFLLPIGIWRSLVHHRKKGQRKTAKMIEDTMKR